MKGCQSWAAGGSDVKKSCKLHLGRNFRKWGKKMIGVTPCFTAPSDTNPSYATVLYAKSSLTHIFLCSTPVLQPQFVSLPYDTLSRVRSLWPLPHTIVGSSNPNVAVRHSRDIGIVEWSHGTWRAQASDNPEVLKAED